MGSRRVLHSVFRCLLVSAMLAVLPTAAWATGTTKLIYSFTGGADGEYTDTELVRDTAGNLYGSSVQGGRFKSGTVFQVTPDGVHTALYDFKGGADGGEPYKGVTLDSHGNLFGTAVAGGGGPCDGGCGVVYELTNSGGIWNENVVHTFTGNDGSGPGSPVAFDRHGNLYGTTPTGGTYGMGIVYRISPNGAGGWSFRIIHNFTGGADGAGGSAGRLLIDSAGNLYGVCTSGGVNGFGIVYEISPIGGKWQFTTLYAFKDQPDGALPYGSVVSDGLGNLYGTTYYAGAFDMGTVYRLSLMNGIWAETGVYSFKGGADGSSPISSLVADGKGNFYGTTSAGGSTSCGCGVIFKMTRSATGTWSESVVYSFPGAPNAGQAYNGMVRDASGNFYGATVSGGTDNDGAIYEFTP